MKDKYINLLQNSSKIYFVCSGNIIRSSFAELYAKHVGIHNVSSYGTTYHNSKIHFKSETKLQEMGVNQELISSFTPTHIEDLANFDMSDLHIVMTSKHRDQLLNRGITSENIIIIKEILGRNGDVADPYFTGNYEEAYSTISEAVLQIADEIT